MFKKIFSLAVLAVLALSLSSCRRDSSSPVVTHPPATMTETPQIQEITDDTPPITTLNIGTFADSGFSARTVSYCGNDNVIALFIGDNASYAAVINIDEQKIINRIELSDDENYMTLHPRLPCLKIAKLNEHSPEEYSGDKYLFTESADSRICFFYPDGSFRQFFSPAVPIPDFPMLVGNTIITSRDGGLTDAQTGEIYIPAYDDENVTYNAAFAFDDNRFIYTKTDFSGDAANCGFGIYDLSSRTDRLITEGMFFPITAKGNRVFSQGTADTDSRHIYAADIETGENVIFWDIPAPADTAAGNYIFAPADGAFIGILHGDNAENSRITLVDTDSGQNFFSTSIPFSETAFASDNYICAMNYDDCMLYMIRLPDKDM